MGKVSMGRVLLGVEFGQHNTPQTFLDAETLNEVIFGHHESPHR
jgi:hypothetical protein